MNSDGKVVIEAQLDTKSFEAQIAETERQLRRLESEYEIYAHQYAKKGSNTAKRAMEEVGLEIEKTRNKLVGLKQQQEKINSQGMGNVKTSLKDIGNSLEKTVHKVARWGLAIFGIRSAYSGIRRIISMVSSQNEGIANQIQQMKNVLASVFVPVVQNIVNWLAKMMVYFNYLFKALTGKNLFNFADATKQASKNLASGASSAKEINKQLGTFDEMDVLQDQNASGGSGGVDAGLEGLGNIFDSLKNIQMPKWIESLANVLKKIKEYWKEVLTVVVAFASAIKAIQFAKFIAGLLNIKKLSPKITTGIGLITSGIVLLSGSIINLILNWDKMSKTEKTVTIALASIGAAFIALGTAIALGISIGTLGIGALVAAVVGLITVLGTMAYKHDQVAKAAKDEKKQTELLKEAKDKAKKAYDDLIDAIDRETEAQKHLIEVQEQTGLSGEELWKSVSEGTLTYEQMNEQQREVYKAYKDLIEAQENKKKATEENIEADKRALVQDFNTRISKAKTREEYEKLKGEIIDAAQKGEIEWSDASDSISRMMSDMSDESRKIFTQDIPDSIKEGLNPDKYKTTTNKFTDWWNNSFLANLSKTLYIGVSFVLTGGNVGVVKALAGLFGFAKGGIVVPKLASGGIINQPGRGVPIGSAIGGESGMEGVIPLTDSQQMELLGASIGRYITINANIVNTMNGKVLSREIQRIQNDTDFASNS